MAKVVTRFYDYEVVPADQVDRGRYVAVTCDICGQPQKDWFTPRDLHLEFVCEACLRADGDYE